VSTFRKGFHNGPSACVKSSSTAKSAGTSAGHKTTKV